MSAVKIQSPQLSVERGPAHAERFGRRGDIALGSRECPLQHPRSAAARFSVTVLDIFITSAAGSDSAGMPAKFPAPDAPRG